ncbi:sulfotransferase family 2 domain-containing protein [Flavimaricola marinus]|uniref:Sulfotransferase family protein n=1 Tax=Flavimaricola marinus TaxID=1819565 RepID=A0A238LHW5_9RHOB|nr:sulfotransferase family 2 domain-containing protein [Flavimaricola marinus]SMY09317.1 Sulfotransferase family protein [Flavimaricola marinus]
MPLIKANGKLVYFAHVPKCAGTAVARYIEARFGPPAFSDRQFLSVEEPLRWTRSSPQHVTRDALERLFPPGFFDASFAIVRHPVERLASVFLFQREKEGTIPPELGFSDWLHRIAADRDRDPFAYDNHTRPMTDFVPDDAVLFRVEDGLEKLEAWMDATFGAQTAEDPVRIPRVNTRYRRLKDGPPVPPFAITAADRALVADLFAMDFDRFGYADA